MTAPDNRIKKYVMDPVNQILNNESLSTIEKKIELEAIRRIHEPYMKRTIPIYEKSRILSFPPIDRKTIGTQEEPDLFRIEAVKIIDKAIAGLATREEPQSRNNIEPVKAVNSAQITLGIDKGDLRTNSNGTFTVQTSLSVFLGNLKTAKLPLKYTMFNRSLVQEDGKPYTVDTLKREIQRWRD